MTESDKHSTLLLQCINNSCKTFYDADLWGLALRTNIRLGWKGFEYAQIMSVKSLIGLAPWITCFTTFLVTFLLQFNDSDYVSGRGEVKDDRGPDEDRGGEAETEAEGGEEDEGGAENHSGKGQRQTKALILAGDDKLIARTVVYFSPD